MKVGLFIHAMDVALKQDERGEDMWDYDLRDVDLELHTRNRKVTFGIRDGRRFIARLGLSPPLHEETTDLDHYEVPQAREWLAWLVEDVDEGIASVPV